MPARRADSGLADAARMALPMWVRAKNRYRPTAIRGAMIRVTTWDELTTTPLTVSLKWKGTG